MRFRPCIDIHNGKVKQIVGGSLTDDGSGTAENYVSDKDAAYYAGIYREKGLKGGHIAMLNAYGTPEYEITRAAACKALNAFPGGLQIGGGINACNAPDYIEAGASHVIVTSYVFRNGGIDMERLHELKSSVGSDHVVLDLSCRKKDDGYYIVTDRWQKMTDVRLCAETLDELSECCDEFLIHAADVEGKQSGIEENVAKILGDWGKKPITYAGGVHSLDDISLLKRIGKKKIDVTVGSALDIFGGSLSLTDVVNMCS